MFWIILSIIFIVLFLVESYIIFNLVRKFEKVEDQLITYSDNYEELKNRIRYIDSEIKSIDQKGSFEADDEVGFFFKELKRLTSLLIEVEKKS